DVERRRGTLDPRPGRDIAIARLRSVGPYAQERDLVGMSVDQVGHLDDGSPECGFGPDVVIAGEDGDRRLGVPACELEETDEDAGAGVQVPRLHEHVRGREGDELRPRQLEMPT